MMAWYGAEACAVALLPASHAAGGSIGKGGRAGGCEDGVCSGICSIWLHAAQQLGRHAG